MSVAEMKLEAINQISKLIDESALKEILEHLSQLRKKEDVKNLSLSKHYQDIKAKYGDVLEKLAQ